MNTALTGFQHPIVQAFIKYVSDPENLALMEKMIQSPERQNLLYAELGWLVIFIALRFWLSLRGLTSGILMRVLMRISTSLLYFAVTSIVLPMYFFGPPYMKYWVGLYEQVIRPNLAQI